MDTSPWLSSHSMTRANFYQINETTRGRERWGGVSSITKGLESGSIRGAGSQERQKGSGHGCGRPGRWCAQTHRGAHCLLGGGSLRGAQGNSLSPFCEPAVWVHRGLRISWNVRLSVLKSDQSWANQELARHCHYWRRIYWLLGY